MTNLHTSTALLLSVVTTLSAQDKTPVHFTGKLSTLSLPAAALGPEWAGPTGLVVDDFNDLSGHPADGTAVAESLKEQLAPLGVVAVADFTYRKQAHPLNQVTLRIFKFESTEKCDEWWQKKYQYEGWEKHYDPVAGEERTLDSKEIPKRAVAIATLWLTCGSTGDPNAHLEILSQYLKRIKSQMK
jgi:hypothetical protein